jgi:hypothetical protein
MANVAANGLLLGAVLLPLGIFAAANSESSDNIEIQRGFAKSVLCIKSGEIPSQWCGAFHNLIRVSTTRSTAAFLLGANFGFSFASESAAERVGADQNELLRVAKCAATARVDYERIKKELHLTDADVSRILKISPKRFAAWKSRSLTSDDDNSIEAETHGITL